MIVNKWRSQPELYVSCLCPSFEFNPTPSCIERSRMQHNLALNKGLEAKAEIEKWLYEHCIIYEDI